MNWCYNFASFGKVNVSLRKNYFVDLDVNTLTSQPHGMVGAHLIICKWEGRGHFDSCIAHACEEWSVRVSCFHMPSKWDGIISALDTWIKNISRVSEAIRGRYELIQVTCAEIILVSFWWHMVIFWYETCHYFTDEIRSECTKFFNSLHLSMPLTLTDKSISGWSLWFPHRKSISGRSFTSRNADAINPVTRAKMCYLDTEVKPRLPFNQ